MTLNGMKIMLPGAKKKIKNLLEQMRLRELWMKAHYIRSPINTRHRIALTKLRLSNHKLVIETGRYSRPFKKPAERICPICKIEMEDEYHFINICPGYWEKTCSLPGYLEKEYRIKISRMSPNKIFMFLKKKPLTAMLKYKN